MPNHCYSIFSFSTDQIVILGIPTARAKSSWSGMELIRLLLPTPESPTRPTMRKDVQEWLKSCTSCQLNGNVSQQHHDVMHPMPVPHAFERWHLDFIGELPVTSKGNKWIITAVDALTNWPIAKAVPVASAEALTDFLYEEIVMRFGCPKEICTDRGSSFTSNLVKAYTRRLGLNHKLTSAFHPRTNSKVERFNGIIKPIIRKYVNRAIHRWYDFLDASL